MTDKIRGIERMFGLSPGDTKKFIAGFHSEMKKGLAGRKSSLKMLPTYATRPTGKENGEFLAIDLGGTNLRVASLVLKGKRKTSIPIIEASFLEDRYITSSSKALFDFIARSIKKFAARQKINLENEHNIGFTFSFPIKKGSIKNGVLVRWTKGFRAKGVEGRDVVGLLNESLAGLGVKTTKVNAIINDTVSTLVSESYEDLFCDMGVILGTGTNACYFEERSKIKKMPGCKPSGQMIINIEWGGFNKVTKNLFDSKLDRQSQNPGEQIFEKMVSGMYLGKLAGLVLSAADFSIKPSLMKSEYISEIESDNTEKLSKVARVLKRLGMPDATLSDRKVAKKLCYCVSTRAAKLSALAMASVVTKTDPELRRKHTIAIDGSLYEKHPGFSRRIKATLKEILGKKADCINLRLTKDASVKGAAIVAATVR